MKKLVGIVTAALMIASLSITMFAVSPRPAVIMDNSYTPIHDRPVVDLFHANGDLNTEFAQAEPFVEINDDSYTPIHDSPVTPLFDENGNATFIEDPSPRAGKIKPCPWCSKSLKSVPKAYYETAGCGHKVYFKGWVCRDWKGCGYIKIDKWIYSCDCCNK